MLTNNKMRFALAFLVFGASVALTVAVLTRSYRSQGLDLVTYAGTWLALSWLLAAGSRAIEEQTPASAETPLKPSLVVFPNRGARKPISFEQPQPAVNAFTVDLEDYFHTEVASQAVDWRDWDHMPSRLDYTVPRLLELLDTTNTRATFFVLGWIAEKYPKLVRQISDCGHEMACHSYRHRAVFQLDRKTFREDTRIARMLIEDATGQQVLGYRAPCFSITPGTEWAFDVLSELEFQYDSSVNPVRHFFYGNSGAPRHPHLVGEHGLLEIPVATWGVGKLNLPVGGGAYLRLLPAWYTDLGLSRIKATETIPYTLYMHPWEIDADQPGLSLSWLSSIRQTFGTASMEERLRGLLTNGQFGPMATVYAQAIRGSAAPTRILEKTGTADFKFQPGVSRYDPDTQSGFASAVRWS